jgi:hypothetical protein
MTETFAEAAPQPAAAFLPPEPSRPAQTLAAAQALYGPPGAGAAQLRLSRRPDLSPEQQAAFDDDRAASWSHDHAGQPLSARRRKPVRYALAYFAELLRASGNDDLLAAAGITPQLEAALFANFDQELTEVQQLVALGQLADCDTLGKLVRGRLTALLMAADTAHEWWLLSRALNSLPAWILGTGQAAELRVKAQRRDHSARHYPQFDYPACSAQAVDDLAEQVPPMNRAQRRRIDATLRKQRRRQDGQ